MRESKDIRSTGRKRLRKALLDAQVPYMCRACNRTNKKDGELVDGIPVYVPENARYFAGLASLQANHKNKNLEDCDPANGEWLDPSCHKEEDQKTEKGVSSQGDEYGYGFMV